MKTTKEKKSYKDVIRQNLTICSMPCHFLMASVVVMREEVVNGGRECIRMPIYRLPACSGGDQEWYWLDVLEWPVTRTSGLHREHEIPTLTSSRSCRSQR